MRTTSRPPRPSKGNGGSASQLAPLKSLRLVVTVAGDGRRDQLKRLAAEKGFEVRKKGDGALALTLTAATPEDALAQLALLTDLLAPRS